ncbi:MAG: GntR family transcriptional regulator [Geobacteraceae bacterium]|nr:GntR family transcriptional regulator [Geobacteraceae bacterium]
MLEIGTTHNLEILNIDERGATLEWNPGETVLLPQSQVPAHAAVGQKLKVFVYRGRKEALIGTLNPPLAQSGEFALMRVKQSNQFGAFMDWGLDKDLLVPFAQQPEKMQLDRHYIVHVGVDNSGRLIGSAKVERFLNPDLSALSPGQEVTALVWQFTDLGAKLILDNTWAGLLYRSEIPAGLKRGDRLQVYVQRVRDDGGMDVSLSPVGKAAREQAAEHILSELKKHQHIPLHDGSTPAEIEAALGLSKKAFKRAVGILYKEGKIALKADGIHLKTKSQK